MGLLQKSPMQETIFCKRDMNGSCHTCTHRVTYHMICDSFLCASQSATTYTFGYSHSTTAVHARSAGLESLSYMTLLDPREIPSSNLPWWNGPSWNALVKITRQIYPIEMDVKFPSQIFWWKTAAKGPFRHKFLCDPFTRVDFTKVHFMRVDWGCIPSWNALMKWISWGFAWTLMKCPLVMDYPHEMGSKPSGTETWLVDMTRDTTDSCGTWLLYVCVMPRSSVWWLVYAFPDPSNMW